jgi:hypothetical protein
MPKQTLIFIGLFLALLALFVSSEKTFSPTFNECVAKSNNDNKPASAEKDKGAFGGAIFAHVYCSGEFLDKNGVAITALATIVIAAFTGTLWIAKQPRRTHQRGPHCR